MSTANPVPETWNLTGSDARTPCRRHRDADGCCADAFERLRASDGFSHARSMAFATSLILVQGVIALVGLASAIGTGRAERRHRRDAPGRRARDRPGTVLTDAVKQAHQAGAHSRSLALTLGTDRRAHHRDDPAWADRASDEPPLRGRAATVRRSEVRSRVRADDERRVLRGGRVHGDDARPGDGLVVRATRVARDVWNIVRWPLAFALLIGATALHLPLEPTPPPARLVVAGDRRAPVGHAGRHRHDRAERPVPAELDVRADVRTARRVRRAVALDLADVDRAPVRRRHRRPARGGPRRGSGTSPACRAGREPADGPSIERRSRPAAVGAAS